MVLFLVLPTVAAAPSGVGTREKPTEPLVAETVVAGGFAVAMTFAPDGTLYWADLEGDVYRTTTDGKTKEIFHVNATRGPEWGIMGITLPPDHPETGDVLLSYVNAPPGVNVSAADAKGTLRIVRVHDGVENLIFSYEATRGHNGGRILVHDGLLFVSNGDHKVPEAVQDPARMEGKILRMTLDGKPAPGNPHEKDPAWHPLAYSTGHRNPFGMEWDPVRKHLVISDPGQTKDEEINAIVPGGNYGHPVCTGPCDPPRAGMTDPLLYYNYSVTPVGMAVVASDYYVGTYNMRELRRVFETADGWRDQIVYIHDNGLLDVEASPDGKWVYFGAWNGIYRVPALTTNGGHTPPLEDGAARPTPPPSEPTAQPTAQPTAETTPEPTPDATPETTPDATPSPLLPDGEGLDVAPDVDPEDTGAAAVPGPGGAALAAVGALVALLAARRRRA